MKRTVIGSNTDHTKGVGAGAEGSRQGALPSPSVLDLLDLALSEAGGVLGESHGVEGAAGVDALRVGGGLAATVALGDGEGDDLEDRDGSQVKGDLGTEVGGLASGDGLMGERREHGESHDRWHHCREETDGMTQEESCR